jgi:hypothetical protein
MLTHADMAQGERTSTFLSFLSADRYTLIAALLRLKNALIEAN